ncbi:MAG: L-histidine N(alpha)-methyltransferase [Bacteroidales bacterium]|nr:L-histidine N(alpha)-methyltransferase [Bacteroidales bacterium]
METEVQLSTFETDTLKGLSAKPKYLSSKYFYDAQGSKIFEEIMRMPEYYLTDCEIEIFQTHKLQITHAFGNPEKEFELIELGAGDGLKTKILLAHLLENKNKFKYIPIDISAKAINDLQHDLAKNLPGLKFDGLIGDYFQLIAGLNGFKQKVILFLGSNIGNFDEGKSSHFLRQLNEVLNPEDQLLIGFDLKKDSEIILPAYNDPHGLTAAFNLNLLHRINNELDANFIPESFFHQETYDAETGTAKSFLVSKKSQSVQIRKLEKTFHFNENEKIFMERSQKYDLPMIEALAGQSGFEITANYFDSRNWFVNSLWRVKI